MRILISRFAQEVGGAEKSFFAHISALQALGHEVHAFTNLPLPDYLETPQTDALWFRRSNQLYKGLISPVQVGQAVRMVRRVRPDIINAHSRFDQILLTLLKPLHGTPVVWKDPVELRQRLVTDTLASKLDARALRRADAVYVLSAEQQQQLAAVLPSRLRHLSLDIVPSGIDFSRYDTEARPLWPSEKLTIGYGARLHPAKGVDDLIRAYAAVGEPSETELLIMGDGEDKQRLQSLVEELGIAEVVHFLPYSEDVSGFLRSLDIYVCPSHYESWGLGVHEARLFGLPIIATNVGGLTEQIVHESNGLLVPPQDVEALGEAIARCVADDKLRFRLGEAAAADARERGDFTQTVEEQLLPIFRRCLS